MTTRELIELLQQQPQDAEVYVSTNWHGCWGVAAKVSLDERGMVIVEDEE